jgi:Lysyl oxidase
MLRACLALLCACGDNRLLEMPPGDDAKLDAAAVDAPPPDALLLPDLSLVGALMTNTTLIMNDTFTSTSCEFVEQCIGDVGTRRLLKFDTVTQNLGTADLVVGVPPPMGISVPPFEWSSCHGHHHFTGYATYELLDGDSVVVAGHKQAFCILDTMRVTPGAPSQGYNCTNQGMSRGWADVYGRGLPCQWIDITDVAAGTYTLRVRINPEGKLIESDYTNNEFTRSITL